MDAGCFEAIVHDLRILLRRAAERPAPPTATILDVRTIQSTLESGALTTGELRERAGFPAGKEQRTAYLKAIEEQARILLLAKFFTPGDDHAHHALPYVRYRQYVNAAERLVERLLARQALSVYLPSAVYAAPTILACRLRLEEAELRAGLDRLVEAGQTEKRAPLRYKDDCYVWMS
jgi:hypothetical protein